MFQANPQTGDRRISGTTASLAGLGRALRHDDGPATDDAVARILLSHALVMGWGGVPVLWSGDEVAALNDEGWRDQPGHDEDNRWAHRPRLDDAALAAADADPASPQGRVLAGLRRLAAVRAGLPHLHASVASEAVPTPDRGVLGVLRHHPLGLMIGLYNVTETWGGVPDWWLVGAGPGDRRPARPPRRRAARARRPRRAAAALPRGLAHCTADVSRMTLST